MYVYLKPPKKEHEKAMSSSSDPRKHQKTCKTVYKVS